MRKIKDVVRLHAAGRSARQIGPSVGLGRSTVAEYLRRAGTAGLSWPLPEGLDEATLERLLFPPPPPAKGRQLAEPDWAAVHRELKRPGVNARTMTSVKSILQNRLDGRRAELRPEAPPITHANIRGPQFFH